MALLTTLLGVVVRVLLYEKHSERKDPPDASDSARKLSVELAESVSNLIEFRRQMISTLSLLAEDASQKVGAAFTEFSSTAQQLEQTAKGVGANLRKGSVAFEKSLQRLSEASQTLAEKTSSLNDHLQELGTATSTLHRNATGIDESVRTHLTSVTELTEVQRKKLNELGDSIQRVSEPVTGLVNSLGKFKDEAGLSTNALLKLRSSIEPNSLKDTLKSTADAAVALQITLLAIQRHFEEYERSLPSEIQSQSESGPARYQQVHSTEAAAQKEDRVEATARTDVSTGIAAETVISSLRTSALNSSAPNGSRTQWNTTPRDRPPEAGMVVREPKSSLEAAESGSSVATDRKRWWRPFS